MVSAPEEAEPALGHECKDTDLYEGFYEGNTATSGAVVVGRLLAPGTSARG